MLNILTECTFKEDGIIINQFGVFQLNAIVNKLKILRSNRITNTSTTVEGSIKSWFVYEEWIECVIGDSFRATNKLMVDYEAIVEELREQIDNDEDKSETKEIEDAINKLYKEDSFKNISVLKIERKYNYYGNFTGKLNINIKEKDYFGTKTLKYVIPSKLMAITVCAYMKIAYKQKMEWDVEKDSSFKIDGNTIVAEIETKHNHRIDIMKCQMPHNIFAILVKYAHEHIHWFGYFYTKSSFIYGLKQKMISFDGIEYSALNLEKSDNEENTINISYVERTALGNADKRTTISEDKMVYAILYFDALYSKITLQNPKLFMGKYEIGDVVDIFLSGMEGNTYVEKNVHISETSLIKILKRIAD